jgi:SAM-dependent methyltransferase
MPPIFREGPGPYALAVAMTAVRLGERLLLVGDEGALFAQLALKSGLTGRACAVVGSDSGAERIRVAASRAGVLMDVEQSALPCLSVGDGEFDVAAVHAGRTVVTGLDRPLRAELARAVHRALRPGGRVIVIEGRPRGFFGFLQAPTRGLDEFRAQGGAAALLEQAGFRPVRLLAEREGQRFTEGLKT